MFRRFSILLLLLNLIACATRNSLSTTEIQSIKNSDVRWDGNAVGLHPTFNGMSKKVLEERTVDFNDPVRALGDERRYIAAHALLSTLTGHSIQPQLGGIDPLTGNALAGTEESLRHFNGLRVDLLADGTVAIPQNQQTQLTSKWKEWLKSTK